MNNIKIFLTTTIILSFLSCGLEQMAMDYDKVVYEQTPTVLEVHGGQVSIDLTGIFPEKYFDKKATVEITPVIIDENGGESKLESIILQGEQAEGGDATIFFESGGKFTYSDKIDYNDAMLNSTLELRALATLEDDNKVLGPVTIASGVITTSMRVENDEIIAVADHGYKEVETISETATIYFLVNKSNIRTTEKSDDDVKKLQEFIKLGYKTESFVVKSSASPEGTEKINTELSDDRQNSTLTYAKYLMKKLKANGSFNDDHYKLSSAGADWDGFNKLVKNSSIAEKSTILSLSNRNKEKTQKERGELLQDMAQVYDALEGDVLQYLRKSEITINSYLPKNTREEILLLSETNPSELTVDELLYSATLEENKSREIDIYNKVIELHNDWRAYNNIAVDFLQKGDIENAEYNLGKALEVFTNRIIYRVQVAMFLNPVSDDLFEGLNILSLTYKDATRYFTGRFTTLEEALVKQSEIRSDYEFKDAFVVAFKNDGERIDISALNENGSEDVSPVLTNLGIIALWDGDLIKAEDFFTKSNASNHNKAILSLRKGDYRSASRYYRGKETYNATLSKILNGDNNSTCSEETSACYYLNAIAGARSGNENRVFTNLEKAINLNSDYKTQAAKDLEFLNYREHEKFIFLTK